MTVESNCAIAIATLSDWLKNFAPVFQPMRCKTQPISPCTRDVSRVLSKLRVIARNSDWFTALSAPVAIGRITHFRIAFWTVIENCSIF